MCNKTNKNSMEDWDEDLYMGDDTEYLAEGVVNSIEEWHEPVYEWNSV